jgi:hypothetical protein
LEADSEISSVSALKRRILYSLVPAVALDQGESSQPEQEVEQLWLTEIT